MKGRGPTGVLHVHSDFSHDGRDSLEQLRAFAEQRGIAFVGLTDHAEDFDAARFAVYVERCRAASSDRVALIPGLEYRFPRFSGLHLLALGLSRWIDPDTPAAFILEAEHAARFTIAAHPVLPRYHLPEEVLNHIDAIEVWNAGYNTRYLPDPRAMRLLQQVRARRPEVVGVAGLDQHDSRNDRETRVVLDRPTTDPLAELKAGRFTNVGRTMRFDAAVSWGPWRLGALRAVREVFDRVERTQDWVARRLAKRSAAS
jgi:hypothetical protein